MLRQEAEALVVKVSIVKNRRIGDDKIDSIGKSCSICWNRMSFSIQQDWPVTVNYQMIVRNDFYLSLPYGIDPEPPVSREIMSFIEVNGNLFVVNQL